MKHVRLFLGGALFAAGWIASVSPGGWRIGLCFLLCGLAFLAGIRSRALIEAKGQLENLNRMYLVLSRVSAATVRVRNREELFSDICSILVDSGGLAMAWIGMLNEGEILPVAHAGREEGYTGILKRTGLMGQEGPVSLMMKSGKPQICQDISTDPRMDVWREEALRRQYRSSAGFPLHLEGSRIGVINVYAAQPDFFSEEITRLFIEIGEAVSFAIQYLEQQGRRLAAEEGLRRLNAELESQVKQRTGQLEAANAELEAFSYSVSHDLRAPLRSIDGFSEILLQKHSAQLDDAARDYLGRVRRSSRRMGELIEDLLALSRVGRSEIHKEEIDLAPIARAVIAELDAANRCVEWTIEESVPVYADSRLMKIVLENLIRNAWKFTAPKNPAKIGFGSLGAEGEKIVYVRDNGVGFDMKHSGKLFGAFQRLHRADEFEGTGVGLATVQRIIHRHDGKIWAEAEAGAGATFYFSL
ncbi:MAG: GAF domain-containing protein [Burkholderiales bacterium]|nr:GAF domain-containing protein [Burkholderiales bacterium]